MIFINIMDENKSRIIEQYRITSSGKILTLKLLRPSTKIQLNNFPIVVVAIDIFYKSELRWYKFNGNNLEQFWLWSVDQQVEKLEYFQHEMENRLIIVKKMAYNYFEIEIYGFDITEKLSKFWLMHRLITPILTNLKLCPTHGGTILIVQVQENIFIYKYQDVSLKHGYFKLIQEINAIDSSNSICFHSGYIFYLVTIGSSSTIWHYFDYEFKIDSTSTKNLQNVGDIYWIESILLDTYREEVLLLIQLKNSSILIFSWQSRGFEMIPLSVFNFNSIDLAKVLVIPKVGFINENKIVRIETQLRNSPPPNYDELKQSVDRFNKLMEIFQKQELIVNETARKIDENYYKNLIVNGIWNTSEKVIGDNNTQMNENIECKTVGIGAINITCHESDLIHEEITSSLEDINAKLNEINLNMINTIAINTTDISSFNNIEIVGNLIIHGMVTLGNLTFDAINNISVNNINKNIVDHNGVIEGEKFFPNIDAEEMTLHLINGIPVNQIIFDTELIDYSGINFSNINKLEVKGDLNFSHVNNINWKSLMKSVIRKSQPEIITDKFIVRGTINAKYLDVTYLNDLKYPDEYVQKFSRESVEMRGKKKFKNLHVIDLNSLKTINNIPIEDFILLNGDTTLDKEITFHNLTVGLLEINGEIKDYQRRTINNFTSNEILDRINFADTDDIIIKKLRVRGNIQVIQTINNKTWSEFGDLLTIDDDLIEIIGKKTFFGRVQIGPGLNIISQKINGHLISEFMTLDTYQELPNLKKINGNVTIDRLVESDAIKLTRLLFENRYQGSNSCFKKNFIFKVPPIVDKISAEFINGYIPSYLFASKLNESFSNVVINNISLNNLYVNKVNAQMVNGLSYDEMLTINALYEKEKNNQDSRIDIDDLQKRLDDLYDKIVNGSVVIRNLTVSEQIKTKILNGKFLSNIYNVSNMGNVIFENDVHIENLIIHGSINGVNFSEFVADAILKNDENIVVMGKKKFKKIICQSLKLSKWNNRSIDDFLDPFKHQVLSGPIIVKGEIIIEEYFNPRGKIGGIYFEDIIKHNNNSGKNLHIINGNFQYTTNDTVDIKKLFVTGNIQDKNFNEFIESVVFLDSENVLVTGTKIFENSISFHNLTIEREFNNINLEKYFREVVRIDKPMKIKSKLIFQNDITINGDLIITKNLTTNTIMGINFNELISNAMYTNQPTTVSGTMRFINLTFQSNIEVEKLNNINMHNLIPLHQNQIIPATLYCQHISVGKLNITGKLNGHDWSAIFNETFLRTGDQNITGNIFFMDGMIVEDFNSKLINDIDPSQMISRDDDGIIVGNFVFNSSVVLNGNLKIHGYLNNVNISKWKNAVLTNGTLLNNNSTTEIIFDNWIVRGNVYFNKDIFGSKYINNINVEQLNKNFSKREDNLMQIVREKKMDLQKLCRDLKLWKSPADRQIFKYKYFEYLQIIKLHQSIISIHHFEYNYYQYLFVNLKNCDLDCFIYNYNTTKFDHLITLNDFGYINRWISFKFRGIIYFLTLGESMCNRSWGNFWKIDNNELSLIIDFGNVTDAKKISNKEFLIITNGIINYYSLEDIANNSTDSLNSWKFKNKNIKFVPNTNKTLIIDDYLLYELKNISDKNISIMENLFKTNHVTSFRVGIYQKEIFVYYDKKLSDNYIFISNNNLSLNYIDQIINVNRPVSIRVINFDNYIENFLVFIESGNRVQIYEYKGIEGFIYRETIRIKAEKLYTIKLRIYRKFVKRNCLVLINNNRLIILEAKMYGEKVDLANFLCTHY
ncbi:hypothetical protein PV328_009623 [Microctonus aethiopoides]|uniref:Uncharacterized protein n=1 Tax=Microctonus aethiopoides TaxID=144406 RepID=A0AA39C688_9HYME|nr:hypothetical protein PV328_009623 [Microctonus aethiopoides]